jgi:hypothetical protein
MAERVPSAPISTPQAVGVQAVGQETVDVVAARSAWRISSTGDGCLNQLEKSGPFQCTLMDGFTLQDHRGASAAKCSDDRSGAA